MSNIYIQEPPTIGKVLMKTSLGDIDIELWSKEAPKACQNFVQLCMEGYYNNTIFHRVIKGFIAQGGDPTGTGSGGESVFGKPFKDEFHQRLKFNRRGLVAMANAGPNDNNSQFFFTLDRADELNKKHTIFGKVTGNTIYNMIRFNEIDVDSNDRPLSPPKIISTEVLSNPFDDIVPRKRKKEVNEINDSSKIKSQSKATKNFKLLSFGEEAEEDETNELANNQRIVSSHDLLKDPKLSSAPAVLLDEETQRAKDDEVTASIRKKLKKDSDLKKDSVVVVEDLGLNKAKEDRRKLLQKEVKKLKRDLMKNEKEVPPNETSTIKPEKEPVNDLMAQLATERKVMLKRKKEEAILKKNGDGREKETLQLLASFSSKITDVLNSSDLPEEESWMNHKLKFEDNEERAKDANMKGDDWYDIYDPRNPITQRRREKSKKAKDAIKDKYNVT
uniref:Spliceosome-associated protein CWC27 homolog n=1 Tax=Hydra vulgaris TaxID=6087 RepID=T2MAL9_HYDVU